MPPWIRDFPPWTDVRCALPALVLVITAMAWKHVTSRARGREIDPRATQPATEFGIATVGWIVAAACAAMHLGLGSDRGYVLRQDDANRFASLTIIGLVALESARSFRHADRSLARCLGAGACFLVAVAARSMPLTFIALALGAIVGSPTHGASPRHSRIANWLPAVTLTGAGFLASATGVTEWSDLARVRTFDPMSRIGAGCILAVFAVRLMGWFTAGPREWTRIEWVERTAIVFIASRVLGPLPASVVHSVVAVFGAGLTAWASARLLAWSPSRSPDDSATFARDAAASWIGLALLASAGGSPASSTAGILALVGLVTAAIGATAGPASSSHSTRATRAAETVLIASTAGFPLTLGFWLKLDVLAGTRASGDSLVSVIGMATVGWSFAAIVPAGRAIAAQFDARTRPQPEGIDASSGGSPVTLGAAVGVLFLGVSPAAIDVAARAIRIALESASP